MLLTQFNFAVNEPANVAADQVMTTLRGVQDNSTPKLNLNVSVEYGLDSVLWDVMYSGLDSSPELFPMIRIFYGNLANETDDGLMGIYKTQVPMWLYFLYYVGVPSQDPVRSSYVQLRENHIRANIDALRMDRLVPRVDGSGRDIWRWTAQQEIVHDNDTPFKYLDSSVQLGPQYLCTRVDLTMTVLGELVYPLA